MAKHPFDPVCEIFPLMDQVDLSDLAVDIKNHGLREPIWRYKGKIIDGRNRFLACKRAGVEPQYREWNGEGSLTSFVLSLNLKRRQLNVKQQALAAAKAKDHFKAEAKERKRQAGQTHGRGQKDVENLPQPNGGAARDKAGKAFGVSGKTVDTADKIQKHGSQELQDLAEEGNLSISAAATVAENLPKKEQTALAKEGPKAVQQAAKKIREGKSEDWLADRAAPFKVAVIGINQAIREIKKIAADPKVSSTTPSGRILGDLKNAKAGVNGCTPERECECGCRDKPKKCDKCKGTGYITKAVVKQLGE
jgi:ParB-like chromosome segregation protein Spo0J